MILVVVALVHVFLIILVKDRSSDVVAIGSCLLRLKFIFLNVIEVKVKLLVAFS